MREVIIRDITPKAKVGCIYCPNPKRNKIPPVEHEVVTKIGIEDNEVWYSCIDHLGVIVAEARKS